MLKQKTWPAAGHRLSQAYDIPCGEWPARQKTSAVPALTGKKDV
jgi:hypothetical protein